MEIQIQREALLKPLGLVAGVVERRHTMPILANVLIETKNGVTTLTGTDLEIELRASIPSASTEEVEFTAPARKLFDICRALPPDALIKVKIDKQKIIVRSGSSRYTLAAAPSTEFPSLEGGDWGVTEEIPQATLKDLFDRTSFCMAQQDVRYYLNGLLVEFGSDHMRAVATDGHRLALGEVAYKSSANRQVIVPRKGVVEIARFLSDLEGKVIMQLSANHIRMSANGVVFTSKLIDGRFPDYTKVVPKNQTRKMTVGRNELRETLTRAAILSNEKYRGVRLALDNGRLQITAHNPEHEEAQEELAVSYSGDPIEVGFNVTYLLEAIGALRSEQVELALTDADSSGTIRGAADDHYTYVVMPMRL